MTLEEKVLALRLFVMHRAAELESVTEACRQLGISRTLFYRWRVRYLRYGTDGLKPRPPRRVRPMQQASAQIEHAVYVQQQAGHASVEMTVSVYGSWFAVEAPGYGSARPRRPGERDR